jgi:hypothetical protein
MADAFNLAKLSQKIDADAVRIQPARMAPAPRTKTSAPSCITSPI